MVFKSLVSVTYILVFTASSVNAATIYTYTGNNFTIATAPYTTSMNITLQFETASPISGTGSMINISSEILSYTISDGINTLTETDSRIDLLINIDTITGQPAEWAIHVTNEFGKSVGDVVNRMRTVYHDFSGGPDSALQAECVIMPIEGGECMGLTGGASADAFHSPGLSGTWSVVPTPAAVWLFGSGLICLIGFAKRKKSWLYRR